MESSESLYKELLSGNPSRETAYRVLSMMKKEGMLEEAAGECAKALETYPDDIRIRQLLAETYFETGKVSEAESEIKGVIARVNGLMSCYRFQADMLISQGRKEEAVEALKLYMIHCPDDRETYDLLESMMPAKDISAGTGQAEEVPATVPGEEAEPLDQPVGQETPYIATATLAEVYFNQGLLGEAIVVYKKVIEQNPDDSALQARLHELEAREEQIRANEEKEKDMLARKRRLVFILESWLEGIRQQANTGLSIG
ncbi:MAG: tetratricopeptide repeat protein [Deltaproteobacteria bacterium]|nr:tetratricopeptide repeat protein [Deltaproteobacteria bacterium]